VRAWQGVPLGTSSLATIVPLGKSSLTGGKIILPGLSKESGDLIVLKYGT